MADDEEGHSEMSIIDARPQMVRKELRKVPGGFGIDDMDDLSPRKDTFDGSTYEKANTNADAQNNRKPSLDPTSLPSLTAPTDSSLYYHQSEDGDGLGYHPPIDESEIDRHLNDVESSFLPRPSPVTVGNKGADDTYLFDGAQESKQSNELHVARTRNSEDQRDTPPQSPPSSPSNYKTPGAGMSNSSTQDESAITGDTTSAMETMSSSPSAAAAARAKTVSRTISIESAGGAMSDTSKTPVENHSDEEMDESFHPTPRKPARNSLLDTPDDSLRHRLSSGSMNYDAGSTPGAALLSRKPSGSRPKFLRSRHASQHSSVSSFITNPDSYDGSELTVGSDYALQSGGALPAAGMSISNSRGLSRTISLGSIASGIEDLSSNQESPERGVDGSLATLNEEELNHERRASEDVSPPETPRATTKTMTTAPTDTIIARHVRNVQVPESLAKEYRTKSGVPSPNKRPGFANSSISRTGKNLTLKEQSSTIERLSKENFDLKLKVMFLSDRLDKLSEEGVREMISENVELKTGLAVMQRDNKALKRKLKELEKRLQDDEERPSTGRSGTSAGESSPKWFDQEGAQEREEELLYLRERVEEYVTEIEKLRNDSIARENEKRNLAEVVRSIGERRGQNLDAREEMDVWKDLLEQETTRREQADEENKKLREEIFRLKTDNISNTGVPGLNHTTNIYNITKKRQGSPSRPRSVVSEDRTDDRHGAISAATTVVDDLRRDCEQLRHENAELRREVGAQTSMLTSRNREKERLHQEIEDLKMLRRGAGGSVAGDSILERSASRAHVRSSSRVSAVTRDTSLTNVEREDFENKTAELRDRINSLKIHNQDLQRELESCMEDFETAVQQKKQAEALATEMQEALETAEADLLTMQTDRDEALVGQEEAEIMFESLRKEAQEELDGFAAEAEEAQAEIERLQTELADTTENFNALQSEMREMSEGVVRLEDEHENQSRRIQDLERDLDEANKELEQMEKNLVDSNGKINRLTVQQESSQGEIAFLREEQDGDKIKIGDLEAANRSLKQNIYEERERAKELDEQLAAERHQREVIASKEKQEVQQYVNELNREGSSAKDEIRRLKKTLNSREVEAAEWKLRLQELENNLREALGDLSGTRSSLLTGISKLQRDLEHNMHDLDRTKSVLAEKERQIRRSQDLLETAALESRKLADMNDKEKAAHRNTIHQFDTFQKTTQHNIRTLSQQESRIVELETSRQSDKRKIASLENSFKEQMNERNKLLLALWNRLSILCGSDWTHNNSLINGRALPSLEAVSTMLPGFAKNLLGAVKTIETVIGEFKLRIRTIEKDLWKEYQSLETSLDVRTRRLDRLETLSRSAVHGTNNDGKAEMAKLKDVNKSLKAELASLRSAFEAHSNTYTHTSPSPSIPTGPRNKVVEHKIRTSTLTRAQSESATTTFDRAKSRNGSTSTSITPTNNANDNQLSNDDGYTPDLRWQIRLQELEYKLKAEREARKTDRFSARQRLQEASRENAELVAEVERNKVRAQMGQ